MPTLVDAVKIEAPGAGPKVSAVAEAGMEVVAGWGGLGYIESLRRGAVGVMPGCDLGPALLAVHRAATAGRVEDADRCYRAIVPLLAFETQALELLVLGAKRSLVRAGVFTSGRMRAPARGLDPVEASTVDGLLDRLVADGVPGFGLQAAT